MNAKKVLLDQRLLIPLVVFSLVMGLCGLVSGWDAMLRCLIFLFATLIPLVFGSIWIYQNFWWRPGWGIMMMASLIGLIGFEIALMGLALNPAVRDESWGLKLGEAALVGVLGFVATLTFGPLVLLIARFFRS
jgi:hypothetical protein